MPTRLALDSACHAVSQSNRDHKPKISVVAGVQIGSFDVSEHLQRLSAAGDPLEEPGRVIDFEVLRPVLDGALGHSDGARGGRPPHDPVAMFKVLILAAQDDVGDERMEFLIRDRPSRLRFLGLGPGNPAPDGNAIRAFRDRLMDGGAIRTLLAGLDRQLREAGHLPMGGQIVDATVASAPRRRNTEAGGRRRSGQAGQPAGLGPMVQTGQRRRMSMLAGR